MEALTIHVLGDSEGIKQIFSAIASLRKNGSYLELITVVKLLATFIVAYQFIICRDLSLFARWIFKALFLYSILFSITCSVYIDDGLNHFVKR